MSLRRSSRTQAQPLPEAPPTHGTAAHTKKRSRQSSSNVDAGPSQTDAAQAMPPPVTPVKRRKTGNGDVRPPPLTPTPSAIGVMTEQSRSRTNGDTSHPLDPQPVEPHHTNATLVTPGGSSVRPRPAADATPSRISALPNSTTLLNTACDHLIAVDEKLRPHVDRHHCKVFSPEGLAEQIDPFEALVSGILSQQVSGAAARSIKNKFIALYPAEDCPSGFPPPALVAPTDIVRLRTAGLSQRKAEYVQGLAQKFVDGELTVQMLMEGSDEEVMEKLVAVRGLGAWSVQMFMCFGLKRLDVFSTGDLGVQRGMAAYMGRDVARLKNKGGKWKYMSEAEMIEISDRFKPYRSLFMWYMWRIEDVDTDAME